MAALDDLISQIPDESFTFQIKWGEEVRTGHGHLLCRENRGWAGKLLPQGDEGARRASCGCAGLRGPIR